MAVALLPAELTGALLAVEVAWGADLTASPGTWTWTDITADVRQDPGIEASIGRADEASTTQPASCTFTLDNTLGRYSIGPQSSNYPNVRRGTPIRVRVRPSTAAAYVVVFHGNAVSWQPAWNLRGTVPTVELVAAGALRRLGQGASPVVSPIRRYLVNEPNCVAYWPMEDGKNATQFLPAVGRVPMTWDEAPDLASNTDFVASQPLPTVKLAVMSGDVGTYTPAADFSQGVRMLVSFPDAGQITNDSYLFEVYLTGTVAKFRVVYGTGGTLGVRGYNSDGVKIVDTGQVGFLVDGRQRLISLEMFQSGGTVFFGLNTLQVGESNYVLIAGGPSVAGTCGLIQRVVVSPFSEVGAAALGHIAVLNARSATDPLTDVYAQLNGYTGESSTARVVRLCAENDVPLTSFSSPASGSQITSTMGYQDSATLLPLLRACESSARAVLYDGAGAGLSYRARSATENRGADLTVAASSAQLAAGFGPVDDDQRLVNKATVTRTGGSATTYEDVTGPLGSAVVGTYEATAEINVNSDEAAAVHAGWMVSRGTIVGYRYPLVTMNLRATPALAAAWLAISPGCRIDVTGLGTTLPGHPAGTLSLLVEGVTNRFAAGEWTGTAKCSLYDVWTIGTAGAATYAGDDVWVLRADTDAATTSAITAVSTTVTVAGAPPWITTAGFPNEFPFDVEIGGRQVTVTAITGAASPQTFTITPTGVAIPSGSTVRLWKPRRVGL